MPSCVGSEKNWQKAHYRSGMVLIQQPTPLADLQDLHWSTWRELTTSERDIIRKMFSCGRWVAYKNFKKY